MHQGGTLAKTKKKKKLSTKERIDQLEKAGTPESILASDWCLDCKNVQKLPDCPNSCDGTDADQKGYVKDKTVNVDI